MLLAGCPEKPKSDITAVELRCERSVNPLGVDARQPVLSWRLQADRRGRLQTAYQVLVAASVEKLTADEGDLWDSGKVTSDETARIVYQGRVLRSGQVAHWKVRVWDKVGHASSWSAAATWTAGMMESRDWQAQWITDPELLRWRRQFIGYRSEETADPVATKWVQLDLGRAQTFDRVRLHPLPSERRGFPLRCKLEASNDPEFQTNVTLLADFTEKDFVYPPEGLPVSAANVRYLRFTATKLRSESGRAHLALSQIEVLASGTNLARGVRVTANDSLEQEPWAASALTDGLGVPGANPRANGTLLLRREFVVRPGLRRALAQVCGLGQYELSLNGATVGRDLLTPGWTAYEKTCLYDTHDITALVHPGENAVGLCLAGGMFCVQPGRYTKFLTEYRPPVAIGQLRLEYADGSVDLVGTDEQWRVAAGPIVFSQVYGGEDCDARREPAGWNQPGFNAAAWSRAVGTDGPGGTLRGASFSALPIRAHEKLVPDEPIVLKPGVELFDLRQNVALMPRLRVRGPAGSAVRIIPAELRGADGAVDRVSCGGGVAYWQYTLAGRGSVEEWFPKFFYQGARYLQVERLPATPGGALPVVEALEGVVVHAAARPTGEFACSNELFNRIQTLVRWAQRSNLMSVLTDCPHREKLGWIEQNHLNGPALRYEFDLTRLFAKSVADMADAQLANGLVPDTAPEFVVFNGGFRDSPEWGSACVLVPWQQYEWTGDVELLRRSYDTMKRYTAYLASRATDDIVSHGLGDWYDLGPNRLGAAQLTPIALTATAFYYYDNWILSQAATLLGQPADARQYAAQAARIRDAFNQKFLQPAMSRYATGSQCANALPLVLGLAPTEQREAILDNLVKDVRERGNAVTAGDVGYRYLLRALADGGRSDVIYEMNNQSEKPGYGYQLQQGATSLTEAWNADRRSSQNHFMLGQINEWFYHDLAGIRCDPEGPGFRKIIIKPAIVGDLTWVKASYDSVRGPIRVAWKRDAQQFELGVSIPTNTTATVHVLAPDSQSVMESGKSALWSSGVKFLRMENGAAVFAVGSGDYFFAVAKVKP